MVVDYDTPYQADGFHIYWDHELLGLDGRSPFNAFCIQKAIDPRWTIDKPTVKFFEARIYAEDTVLVGFPPMSYDHVHHVDDFVDNLTEAVVKHMDETRNEFAASLKDGATPIKRWVLLKFPPRAGMSGVRLSTKEIYQNDDNTDECTLELNYFPVQTSHERIGDYVTWWASWNVVCHDAGDSGTNRKRGKPDLQPKMSKAAEQMGDYLASIYGGDGGDGGGGGGTAEMNTDMGSFTDLAGT